MAPRERFVVVASLLGFLFFWSRRNLENFSFLASSRLTACGSRRLFWRARGRFSKKSRLDFFVFLASRSWITEKKRCASDAYSYLRYLRFLFFCKLVLSPLSCGILKIVATDAHSYFRYLRFAVVCNLAVSPLSWGFLKIIASDAYSYFRYFRFAVLTNRVCLHFHFDAHKSCT